MPGLLDFMDSDEGRLGLGLLMAGGRRSDGAGFGQRISEGMNYVQSQKEGDSKRKIQQAQIDNFNSEIEARKLAGVKDARQQSLIESMFGGKPSASSQPSAQGFSQDDESARPNPGIVDSGGGQPAQIGRSGGQSTQGGSPNLMESARRYGIPEQAIKADMVFNGGKGISAMLAKQGTPDMQVTNGYAYDKNQIGAGFMPSLSTSTNGQTSMTQIGRDGMPVVSAPQGALSTFGAYKGMETGLGAAAKVNLRDNPDGTKTPVSELTENPTLQNMLGGAGPTLRPTSGRTGNPMVDAVMQTESNGNPNAVSPKGARGLMQVMPGTNTSPGFGVAPARDNSEGERTRVGQDYLGAMQDKYKDPALAAIAYNWGPGNTDMWLKSGGDFKKLPPETQSYVAQVLTRNGVNSQPQAPSGPPRYGISTDQAIANKAKEETAVGTARADVVRDTGQQKETKLYGQLTVGLDRAIALLGRGPTSSGAGSIMDSTANFFGQSTKGADAASQLDTISGWLTSNVPRMEGPQSDKDVANYRIMAAEVGNRTKPISQRMAAAKELQGLQAKYAELNGGTANTGGATGDFGAAPTANKSAAKTVVKTGMYGGKRVVQYSDGSTDYAN